MTPMCLGYRLTNVCTRAAELNALDMGSLIKFISILLSLTFAIGLGYSSLAYQPQSENFEYRNQKTIMSLLHIALQDGFLNDEVIIKVNGEEAFHESQVKTRFQIGLAASFETNVPEGLVNVKVTLPKKKLAQSTVLEISAPTYLGISITADDNIVFQVSNQGFKYL